MKRILIFILLICLIFPLSGCKKNELTSEDVIRVINENKLNILNKENCGYKGKELVLEVDDVTIEKSNVFEDDASCDAKAYLSSKEVKAEVFYRFDLTKEKKSWGMKTVKNYKKFTLVPVKGVDDEAVLEELERIYSSDCSFNIDSNDFNQELGTCNVAISCIKESDTSQTNITLTAIYTFDSNTVSWVLEDLKDEVLRVEEWNPEGQWRFTDKKYFYRIKIQNTDTSGETAQIKVIASEHESVIDTADFQQTQSVFVTPSGNNLYFEPFEVETGEEKTTLMLCLKSDGLYFCTDNTEEYIKVNLPRYSQKEY